MLTFDIRPKKSLQSELIDMNRRYKYQNNNQSDNYKLRNSRCEELEEWYSDFFSNSCNDSYSNPTVYNNYIETEYVEESLDDEVFFERRSYRTSQKQPEFIQPPQTSSKFNPKVYEPVFMHQTDMEKIYNKNWDIFSNHHKAQEELSDDRITPTFDTEESENSNDDSLSFGCEKDFNEVEVRMNIKHKRKSNLDDIWELSQKTWKDITPM